jgi:hypothetical protein
MRDWLATHPPGQTLWVELELDAEGGRELPCAITGHVRAHPGEVRSLLLARCSYHPALLDPDPPAVAELGHILRRPAPARAAAPAVP